MKTRISLLQLSAVLAISSALAQPVTAQNLAVSSTTKPDITVASLEKQLGVRIVTTQVQLPASTTYSNPASPRIAALQDFAKSSGQSWQKVYSITNATVAKPVTTYVHANTMIDQSGTVTIAGDAIPAADAIRTIGKADGAVVEFANTPPTGTISLNLQNTSLDRAMAIVAHRTHTHWAVFYRVGPTEPDTMASPNQTQLARRPTMPKYNDGPYLMHFAPIVPVSATQKKSTGNPKQGSNTNTPSTTTNNITVNPTVPAYSPYYNPYGFYSPSANSGYGFVGNPYGYGLGNSYGSAYGIVNNDTSYTGSGLPSVVTPPPGSNITTNGNQTIITGSPSDGF